MVVVIYNDLFVIFICRAVVSMSLVVCFPTLVLVGPSVFLKFLFALSVNIYRYAGRMSGIFNVRAK